MAASEISEAQVREVSRAWRAAVVAMLGLHALAVAAQPLLAGAYLNGHLDAIGIHAGVASAVVLLALIQLVLTLLYRLVGGGPWWPCCASLAILVLEVVQVTMGYQRQLGIHIPLGVTVVGGVIAMFAVFLRTGRAPTPIAQDAP